MVMINLLPYTHKQQIRAGRTNVILVRYIAILIMAAAVLSALTGATYFTLNTTKADAETKVADNQTRVAEYQTIKLEADSFRADLATAKTILDTNVSYSRLIYKIANTIPGNVILGDLALDPQTLGTDMTMAASAKTFEDAGKLKDALIRNDEVFSNVKLLSIRSEGSSDGYPVKVSLSVVINKGALQ
jgi:Tfp pilus assembly protein PilN